MMPPPPARPGRGAWPSTAAFALALTSAGCLGRTALFVPGSAGAPCRLSDDCAGGLSCVEQVCRWASGDADPPVGDPSAGDPSSGDAGGGGDGFSTDVDPLPTLTVEPVYPTHGADWNAYVENDGADAYSASDTACAGPRAAIAPCLHGGELRQVAIPTVPTCADLDLADSLGAFVWACDDAGGTVVFRTAGFQPGKGLKDLLDPLAFKPLHVTLSGGRAAASAPAVWWSNPIAPLPDNSAGPHLVLDETDDGGNDDAFAPGTIFTLAASRQSHGYQLGLDRAALVVLPGQVLTLAPGSANNCSDSGASANERCLLFSVLRQNLWLEGAFSAMGATWVLFAQQTVLSRVHQSTMVGGGVVDRDTLLLGLDSRNNLLTNLTITDSACDGLWLQAGADYNQVYDLTVTGGTGGVGLHDVDGNQLVGIEVSSPESVGIYLDEDVGTRIDSFEISDSGDDGIAAISTTGAVLTRGIISGSLGYGVVFTTVTDSELTGVRVLDSGGVGVNLDLDSDRNRLTDITVDGSGNEGFVIAYNGSNDNLVRNLRSTNNGTTGWGPGLVVYGTSTGNRVIDARLTNNNGHGLNLYSGAAGNTFHRVVASNNANHGVFLEDAHDNVLTRLVAFGNHQTGVFLGGASGNVLGFATVINNAEDGLRLSDANRNTFVHLVTTSHPQRGIAFTSACGNNTFAQTVVAHNAAAGVDLGAFSSGDRFAGLLIVGNNGANCVASGATAGLVDTTCTLSGSDGSSDYPGGSASTALFRVSRSLAASFVGMVTADDLTNQSDTAGAAQFPGAPSSFDWVGFDNPFRTWGDGDGVFPSAAHQVRWTSGQGRIWDLRLRASDVMILDRVGDGATADAPFVNGAACPTPAGGNVVGVDLMTIPNTFLLNAAEIIDPDAAGYDPTGDHDGLCETDESCIYAPNFGAYPGHAGLGTCTVSPGTVTGVTMMGFVANGI